MSLFPLRPMRSNSFLDSVYSIQILVRVLKFRFSLKATEFGVIFLLVLIIHKGEDCAKFLWPSQNIWTLAWLSIFEVNIPPYIFSLFLELTKKLSHPRPGIMINTIVRRVRAVMYVTEDWPKKNLPTPGTCSSHVFMNSEFSFCDCFFLIVLFVR